MLLAAVPSGRHEVRRLEHGEVLADGLPGHGEAGAELAERLPVAAVEAVEQRPPARVGQGPEDVVHRARVGGGIVAWHAIGGFSLFMQPFDCVFIIGSHWLHVNRERVDRELIGAAPRRNEGPTR